MPITPLSKPLKTEYKPLGLEAFAQPLSQMQARFDVAKSQIEDADYKIDALSWADGDQQAAKELADSYNQQASDLAGKLIRSGNYREASSALKKINKGYNNDAGIQAYQSNAAAYKAIVAEMDKAVQDGHMTPEYRDTKLRKIRSEFSGTNFNPDTNEYNRINASSAMNNIKIEDKILTKAEKLAAASAERQDFILGQEVTRKLRGQDGRLAFDDIVRHLRQSSEFKEYSKEKAELDFFAENERALQSENPFALADDLIGSKLKQIDQALEFYSQDPEGFKNEIREAQTYKEELLALAENKVQDPEPYFGTAENIYIANHDYLQGVGGTAADIYDYQKIDIEKSGKTSSAKEIEKINSAGPLSTEVIGVDSEKALKIKTGSPGLTQEEVLIEAGVSEEKADLGTYMTTLDNTEGKLKSEAAGKIVYIGSDIETDKKKVDALKESQEILGKEVDSNADLIRQKRLALEKPLSANKQAMLQEEIKSLENKNAILNAVKDGQTRAFSNLITLSGSRDKPAEKVKGNINLTSTQLMSPQYAEKFSQQFLRQTTYGKSQANLIDDQMIEFDNEKFQKEISTLANQYGSDVTGFLEALTQKAIDYTATASVRTKVQNSKIKEQELQGLATNVAGYVASNASTEEKQKEVDNFNIKSNSALKQRDWTHYQQYLNGEHLKEGAKEEKEYNVSYAEKGHLSSTKKGNIKTDSQYTVIMDGYNKVQTALDKYEKQYNYVQKLKAENEDNPYAQTLNGILEGYEEATTLKNARVQTINAVVLNDNFATKVPSAKQFMTDAASNLKEYVVTFDPDAGTASANPGAGNVVPNLYDTKTLRSVAVVHNPDGTTSNIYAVNRKSTIDNTTLSVAFGGGDKKSAAIEEGESFEAQNKEKLNAIRSANPAILYLSDRGTNLDLINQAKLSEVQSLEELQKSPDYEKQSSAWTQAQNTVLNDLVNLALLDTEVRMEYVSQADNLRENLMNGVEFDFPPVAPSVIKTVDKETKYVQAGDEENVVIAKPGDKVYNTIEYSTSLGRKLSYRVVRNIIVGYNQDNTPIVKKQIVEADSMKSSGIAQQMMKHSIMFGVGNPNTSVLDRQANIFNTDRGF